MGSFGGALSGFAKGFKSGYELVLDSDRQKLDEYRYGRPPEDEKNAMPGTGEGGVLPETAAGTDPGQTSSTGTGDASASSGVNDVDTSEIAGRLKADLMKDFGISEAGANGIVGSLAAESGGFKMLQELKPTVAGSRGGFGYAQWTGPRRRQFEAYIAKNGLNPKSYEANYGFLREELKGSEGKVLEGLKGATDNQQAMQTFTNGFLRPGIPNWGGRKTWTDKIAGVKPAVEPATGTAAAGVGDAVTEQGGDPNSPTNKALADLKEKDAAEPAPDKVTQVDMIPVPESATQPTQVAGWTQYAQPVTWDEENPLLAAEGGVIPDQTMKKYDQYNAMVAKGPPKTSFTPRRVGQAPGGAAPRSSFTPRRVGQAPTGYGVTPGATPSQLKFRASQVAPPVAAAAPVAAAPVNNDALRKLYQQKASYLAQQRNNSGSQNVGMQRAMARKYDTLIGDVDRQISALKGFARGGKVTTQPKDFERRVASEHTMSSRGDDAGQSARDRAARRITEGGRSTAIDPDGYWTKPAKPRIKDTPRHRKTAPDPIKTGTTKPLAQPATGNTITPEPGKYQPKPGRLSDENAIPDPVLAQPATGNTITQEPGVYQPKPGRLSDENTGVLPEDEAVYDAPGGWRRRRVGTPTPEQGVVEETPPPTVAGEGAAFNSGTGWRGKRLTQTAAPLPNAAVDTAPTKPLAQPAGTPSSDPNFAGAPDQDSFLDIAIDSVLGDTASGAIPTPQQPRPGRLSAENTPLPKDFNDWPPDLQQAYMQRLRQRIGEGTPAFADGGVIPEDPLVSQRAESAAYQQPQPQQQQRPEPEDRQPTPKLLQDVGTALKGGMDFLKRTFGLDGGGGAIDDQETASVRQDGVRRLVSGEGAATPEEIQGVYDKVDPQRQMSEGDRYMDSMAKTMQWYLMNGRKDDAEGAAASLIQYGGRKFSQLGSLASAAYKEYQETGDASALENATGYLEKAYEYIPDGGSFDQITIDPETGRLMTTKRNADGSDETVEIEANQLPGLLQQVQNGSAYWKEISRLADPEGARQKERFAHEDQTAVEKRAQELADTREKRGYEEGQEKEKRTYESGEHDRKARVAADIAKEAKLRDEALLRSRPKDKTGQDVVLEDYQQEYYDYWKAYDAYNADDNSATPENKAALDQAGSKLFEAVKGDAKALKDLGVEVGEAGFTPQQPKAAKPANYPDAKWGKDPNTGEGGWFRENPPGSKKYERVG